MKALANLFKKPNSTSSDGNSYSLMTSTSSARLQARASVNGLSSPTTPIVDDRETVESLQAAHYQSILIKKNKSEDDWLQLAQYEFHRKDYNKCLTYTDNLNKKDVKNYHVLFLNAQCYIKLKCYDSAIDYLKRILLKHPNYPEVTRLLLESYLKIPNSKYQNEALELTKTVHRFSPNYNLAIVVYGLILYQKGHSEQALINLKNCSHQLSNDDEINFILAELYRALNDDEHAKVHYLKAITTKPNNETYNFQFRNLIEKLITQKQYQTTIAICSEAIALSLSHNDYHFLRAKCLVELNQFEAAISDLNKSINKKASGEKYSLLSKIYLLQNKLTLCQENLEHFNRLSPNNYTREEKQIFLGLVLAYLKSADYKRTIELCEFIYNANFIKDYDYNYDRKCLFQLRLYQFYAHSKLGNKVEANQIIELLLRCHLCDSRIYAPAGKLCIETGDLEKSLSMLKKAIKSYDPNEFTIDEYSQTNIEKMFTDVEQSLDALNIGQSIFDNDEPRLAIIYLEKAIRLIPTNAKALQLVGICHYKLKDYEQALDNLIKAQALKPDKDTAKYIGLVYQQFDLKKAKSFYEDALKLFPQDSDLTKGLINVLRSLSRQQPLKFLMLIQAKIWWK